MDDFGLNHPSWVSAMNNFKSKDIYIERIIHFYNWQLEKNPEEESNNLINYFDEMHGRYTGGTLRSWLSVFKKFWQHTERGDLSSKLPIIEDNISKWEKTEKKTKAKPFTEIDISKKSVYL
jgi:alpha-galactosidase/6-phospho-beta-glucosidase family protein